MVQLEKPGFDTAAFPASAGLGRRIIQLAPEILLKLKSPPHEQGLAPRVFHLNLQFPAPRVINLKLKHDTTEQATAPRIFHLNRHARSKLLHRGSSVLTAAILHRGSSI